MDDAADSAAPVGHAGIGRKLRAGAIWMGGARLVMNSLGFVSSLILAWLLTPEDFGLVAIALAILTITAEITELSMSTALIQRKAPTDDDFSTAFTLNAIRALILGGLVAAASVPAAEIYEDERLIDIMLVLAAGITCHGFLNPKFVIFMRRLDFRAEAVLGISQKLGGFIVGVGVALWLRSYWAIIMGTVASQLIAVIISYGLIRFRPRFTLKGARSLLSFSIWLSLSRLVQSVTLHFDQLVIGFVLGAPKLGAYSYGENLANMVTREMTRPVVQTLFPGFARIASDPERLRRAYTRAQGFLVALALPIGFGFAIIARPLVLFALGPKWTDAIVVLQFISAALAIQSFGNAVQPLALAMAETRAIFRWDVFVCFARVPTVLAGLFAGGLAGAAYGRCVAAVMTAVINMTLARRLIQIPLAEQLAANWRSIAATAAMVGVGLALQAALEHAGYENWVLVLSTITAGALTYFGTAAVLWVLAGRPTGPETELKDMIVSVVGSRGR